LKDLFGVGWGWISAILIIVSGCPYMRQIYRRKIERPVVTSWVLWFAISIILFKSNTDAGAELDTTLPAIIMGVINPAIIVILSVHYGQYKWDNFDSACVMVCAITIVVWQMTDSPLLGILGGITADAIAAIPQIIKSWKDPGDEPVFPWSVFAFASALNIFAVEEWVPKFWVYPVYMTIGSVIITVPLVLHRLKLYQLKPAKV
jgi:hypothetical protein